jgi:hypothetical protein
MAQDYFRGDQDAGISAPNLLKPCDYADHIVNARGKKTAFTSVSIDRQAITIFGERHYVLLQEELIANGHGLIEHEALIGDLRNAAANGEKEQRTKAIAALRYARKRKEGLVNWAFDISRVPPKDIITWAFRQVQPFFKKV